jgi:nitrogen fixation/metabolism regulation signal transduction histidine kinase
MENAEMTFVKPDRDDVVGIVAFVFLCLQLLLLLVTVVMTAIGFTPDWFKPIALALSVALPAVFAGCVIVSEVAR